MNHETENHETDCEITVYDGSHSTCEMNDGVMIEINRSREA
jgi:hypothetical protein